jgi:hypothetical protein
VRFKKYIYAYGSVNKIKKGRHHVGGKYKNGYNIYLI